MFPEDSILPLRSRLGCKTCKARRVKCGQERPSCMRCNRSGRRCEYASAVGRTFASVPATRTVLDHPLSETPNTVWRERRAFAHYFHRAAVSVGGELDVDFWRKTIPQVCRTEPAVWDAMIALSSLLESPDPCPDLISFRRLHPDALNRHQRDALSWYSRSVVAVRRHLERGGDDLFVGLVTCVLFICIEALMGGLREAAQLYDQGVRLILALRGKIARRALPAAQASLLEDTIVPIFIRLGMLSTHTITLPMNALMRKGEYPTGMWWFPSLKAAREAIVILVAEIQLLEQACNEYLLVSHAAHVTGELMERQRGLSTTLEAWHSAFTTLMKSTSSRRRTSTGGLLLAYYNMSCVILAVCVSRPRVAHDACIRNFQNIVEQASIFFNDQAPPNGTTPLFTCEIGVGFPLWFTCLRCSDPTIRRTALALLQRAHRVQGFSNRDHGATVGKWVIMLEETYGRALSAAYANRGAQSAAAEHSSRTPGDMDDLSSLFSSLDLELTARPGPSFSALELMASSANLVPEEARIRPHGVFRPRDGFPLGTTEADLTKWGRSSDQTFLQFSRTQRDPSNGTWQVIYSSIPINL